MEKYPPGLPTISIALAMPMVSVCFNALAVGRLSDLRPNFAGPSARHDQKQIIGNDPAVECEVHPLKAINVSILLTRFFSAQCSAYHQSCLREKHFGVRSEDQIARDHSREAPTNLASVRSLDLKLFRIIDASIYDLFISIAPTRSRRRTEGALISHQVRCDRCRDVAITRCVRCYTYPDSNNQTFS
jgi:hypothetical protein